MVLATAAKWATVKDRSWRWAIIDEAYQMRSDTLLPIAGLFERALFVGDPGQLDPFSVIETPRWIGLSYDPMQSAVTVLLAHNPDLPVHRLPVSWRLPASAAPLVSAAFYPFTPFRAATAAGTRHLEFPQPGYASAPTSPSRPHGPAGHCTNCPPGTRPARTARPPSGRRAGGPAAGPPGRRHVRTASGRPPLTPQDIAIGTAHRDQADQIRRP